MKDVDILINEEGQFSTPRGNGQDEAKVPSKELTDQVNSIPELLGPQDCKETVAMGDILNSALPVDYRGCAYKTKPNEMNTGKPVSEMKGLMDLKEYVTLEEELMDLLQKHSKDLGKGCALQIPVHILAQSVVKHIEELNDMTIQINSITKAAQKPAKYYY